jgi:DNA-binding IclR family transcriptional regulator
MGVEHMHGQGEGGDVRLPAVDRALDVVELIASSNVGLTLSEICRRAHIPKSSAHYLLYTLLTRGFVQRNLDGSTYSLGPSLTALADVGHPDRQVQLAVRPDLRDLARKLGVVAVASVLKSAEVSIVEVANPPGKRSGGQWVGRHLDSHCTSHGKILLAGLPDTEVDLLFSGRPLAKFTPNTICSLPILKQHLAMVRAQGFALNDEEHIVGTRGIAAPVVDHVRHVLAAVGVTGTTVELPQERIPAITHLVVLVSREISRRFLEALPTAA